MIKTRALVIVPSLLLPFLSLVHAGAQEGCDTAFADSFENGIDDWEQGADLPEDPNNPGHPVAAHLKHGKAQAADGAWSVEAYIDGRQDDGTVWLQQHIAIDPDCTQPLRLSVQAWSPLRSDMDVADLVLYLGLQPPVDEGSFTPRPGPGMDAATRERLYEVDGWCTYGLEWQSPPGTEGLYVALGISVVWETEVTHHLDDVRLWAGDDFVPAPTSIADEATCRPGQGPSVLHAIPAR